jgi:hypothetical protein
MRIWFSERIVSLWHGTKSLFSEPKIFHALNAMQFSNIRRDPARHVFDQQFGR